MKFKKLFLSLLIVMSSTSLLLGVPGIRIYNQLPKGTFLQITVKSGPYTFMGDKAMMHGGPFGLALQDGVSATLLNNGVPSSTDYVEFKSLPDTWPNGVQKISIESHGKLAAECDSMTNCTVHFIGQMQ